MIELTDIDERDIFKFVFFTELLDAEKRAFLESNEEKFKQIDFYKKLKYNINKSISPEVRKKLAEKIKVYRLSNVIKLFPVVDEVKKHPSDMPILAAASAPEPPAITAKTFIDENKTFLIRFLTIKDKTKIFTFPITHTDADEIKLTLHPEELNFTTHKDQPIELEGRHEVEWISVEVN